MLWIADTYIMINKKNREKTIRLKNYIFPCQTEWNYFVIIFIPITKIKHTNKNMYCIKYTTYNKRKILNYFRKKIPLHYVISYLQWYSIKCLCILHNNITIQLPFDFIKYIVTTLDALKYLGNNYCPKVVDYSYKPKYVHWTY